MYYKEARAVARRFHKRIGVSLPSEFDDFEEEYRELSEKKDDMSMARYKAKTEDIAIRHFKEIGRGMEASVWELTNNAVLKIYEMEKVARGEYVIFIDPQYQLVTPEAYEHAEDWKWTVIERVEPLQRGDWSTVFDDLPNVERWMHMAKADERYPSDKNTLFQDLINDFSELRDLFEDVKFNNKEVEWMRQVKQIHDDLGLRKGVSDLYPSNMGVDSDGHLVILDIYLRGAT
jgi:hypothetical protein